MSRSVNMVIIIGNLTRDPEMRYTPQGHAVTSFGVATNRRWVTDDQERESTEYHNIVAWNKLAEICSQFLSKGRKVYVKGRLKTRTWDDQNGTRHWKTEIVCEDMVILDKRPGAFAGGDGYAASDAAPSKPVSAPARTDVKSVGPEKPVVAEKEEGVPAEGREEKKEEKAPSSAKALADKPVGKKKLTKEESKKKDEDGSEDVNPSDMPF